MTLFKIIFHGFQGYNPHGTYEAICSLCASVVMLVVTSDFLFFFIFGVGGGGGGCLLDLHKK